MSLLSAHQSTPQLEDSIFVALEKIAGVFQFNLTSAQFPQALSPLQTRILTAIQAQPQGLTFMQLSQSLGISRSHSTISVSLNSLVKQGLIAKERNPADRRQFFLRLTPQGQQHQAEIQHFSEQVGKSLKALSAAQQLQLLKSLLTFLHQLQIKGLISATGMCLHCCFFEERPQTEPFCRLLQQPLSETPFPRNWYEPASLESQVRL